MKINMFLFLIAVEDLDIRLPVIVDVVGRGLRLEWNRFHGARLRSYGTARLFVGCRFCLYHIQ
jgi:hypothetical protein